MICTGCSTENQPEALLLPIAGSFNQPESGCVEGNSQRLAVVYDQRFQPPSSVPTSQGVIEASESQAQALASISGSEELKAPVKWNVEFEFAVMLSKLIPLIDKALELKTLKRFLRFFCDATTGKPHVQVAIYEHCTSTKEILDTLLQQCRFHCIQLNLLRRIVESYGCGDCKRLLQEYEAKMPKSAPLKRSCNELSDVEIESSSGTKRLKVEITGDSDTCCLEDVESTQEALEKATRVDRDVIVFAKHEPGSVILTFIIPEGTVKSFTDISKSEKKLSDLATIGILSIKIDQVTIDVKAHLVPQKLERLTLEEQEAAHPTPLKPSTLKPTPSSEGTDSGGVGDPTVSQHGLFHPVNCLPEVPPISSPIVILTMPLATHSSWLQCRVSSRLAYVLCRGRDAYHLVLDVHVYC